MEQKSKLIRSRSWLKEEDDMLRRQINAEAKQNWKSVATKAGLKRSANSCRLRYINHLKPRTRPGKLTVEEKLLILEFRSRWGGRNWWSKISKHLLPGRTDNDLKNFWHTLAKKANREGRDANSEATLKRAEFMETINEFGKFTMDYSSLISSDGYDLLKELFPHIVGGGAPTESADSSPIITDATVASVGCGFVIGTHPQLQYVETPRSLVAVEQQLQKGFTTGLFDYGGDPGPDPVLPALEPTDNTYTIAPQIHVPVQQQQQLLKSGLFYHGGGPTGFNQVPAAALRSTFTGSRNQGLSHMQASSVTSPDADHVYNTFVHTPQFHVSVEQHEQLGFNSGFFDHGGGPIGLNKAMAVAALSTPAFSYAEEELGDNKNYFDFADFRNSDG